MLRKCVVILVMGILLAEATYVFAEDEAACTKGQQKKQRVQAQRGKQGQRPLREGAQQRRNPMQQRGGMRRGANQQISSRWLNALIEAHQSGDQQRIGQLLKRMKQASMKQDSSRQQNRRGFKGGRQGQQNRRGLRGGRQGQGMAGLQRGIQQQGQREGYWQQNRRGTRNRAFARRWLQQQQRGSGGGRTYGMGQRFQGRQQQRFDGSFGQNLTQPRRRQGFRW